jgi:hypothetical protein
MLPRQRNVWVTDRLEWRPSSARAAREPMRESAASAFYVRSQLPFEPVCPLGKRDGVRGRDPGDREFGDL